MSEKVVLAYSGGLDTSVILKWLVERGYEVVAFVADVGQDDDFDRVREKALKAGASRVYVEDLKEEFVTDFIFPAFKANAIYEGRYLLGTALARPLIARHQIRIAAREQAKYVSHGATGKGNDQVRFELTYYALNPRIRVIAPWKMPEFLAQFQGRQDMIDYCRRHRIPVEATAKKPYSMDRNLLHISYEGGILEDPWNEPTPDIFKLSVSPEDAPDRPEYVEIEFRSGDAVAVNGRRMSPLRVMQTLNTLAGRHGVGRVDLVENRFVGMKSRGVYETPAGTVLHRAREAVEQIAMDREVLHLRNSLVPRYAEMVYYGFWFAPEREMLQAAMDAAASVVTGTARLKLFKGSCAVVGRKAPRSLYNPHIASFEGAGGYDQGDATGFIKLNALRLRVRATMRRRATAD